MPSTDKNPAHEDDEEDPIIQGTETVLIVDDEKLVANVEDQMLANLGYHVMVANSGAEAVEIYRANQDSIQFVILDIVTQVERFPF